MFVLGAKCTTFPEIKNGFITDVARAYYYNDEARVQCYKGYKLIGNSILRCGENHQFNNPPKCEDINECAASQCDVASTECANTPGSFHCKCRKGFAPTLECRPVGDLGLMNGGIPDESITVSSSEVGYEKSVLTYGFLYKQSFYNNFSCRWYDLTTVMAGVVVR